MSELAAQMRLDGQLVLAARGDFAVQLQVVHELHVPGAGLIELALAPIGH